MHIRREVSEWMQRGVAAADPGVQSVAYREFTEVVDALDRQDIANKTPNAHVTVCSHRSQLPGANIPSARARPRSARGRETLR